MAIKKSDGTIECSPFHVKIASQTTARGQKSSKVVRLKVNGKPVPLSMKIGRAGEAFFLERKSNYDRRESMKELDRSGLFSRRESTTTDVLTPAADVVLKEASVELHKTDMPPPSFTYAFNIFIFSL